MHDRCREEKRGSFGPEPNWKGKKEGEARAVAEEVKLVEFFIVSGVAISFCSSGLVEEFLGEDVLGDKDEGAAESAEDAEEVAGEFDAAGEDDAHCERDQGEICGGWVVNVEEEAVCEDRKEWGKAFDGVDKGDGDFLRCGGGEDVAADLEEREG